MLVGHNVFVLPIFTLFLLFQSYVKEGLSIYKAIKETSKRVNVTVPTLYTFLKEFGAHGDLISAPRTRDSKDFFDKLTDYQRDMIRNIMHNELRKSSVEKKLTNKKRIFSLINVHNVISQKTDLPTMSKSTLWKIVHCLGRHIIFFLLQIDFFA